MKSLKTQAFAAWMIGSLFAVSALAGEIGLKAGQTKDLADCGGQVELKVGQVSQQREIPQVNVILSDLQDCSNFDIIAKGTRRGDLIDVDYESKKIPQASHGRSGSFTIPADFVAEGRNEIVVRVQSNSGKTSDIIRLQFDVKPKEDPRVLKPFKEGDEVLTVAGIAARIVALLPGGQDALIDVSGFYLYVETKDLASTQGCLNSICVGEDVILDTGLRTQVVGLFHDGRVFVYNSGYGLIVDGKTVAVTKGCSAGFCVGDAVTTRTDRKGKVVGLYANGKVRVEINGRQYTVERDFLFNDEY